VNTPLIVAAVGRAGSPTVYPAPQGSQPLSEHHRLPVQHRRTAVIRTCCRRNGDRGPARPNEAMSPRPVVPARRAMAAACVTLHLLPLPVPGYEATSSDVRPGGHIIRNGEGQHPRPQPRPAYTPGFTRAGQPWYAWEWLSDVVTGGLQPRCRPPRGALFLRPAIDAASWLWFRPARGPRVQLPERHSRCPAPACHLTSTGLHAPTPGAALLLWAMFTSPPVPPARPPAATLLWGPHPPQLLSDLLRRSSWPEASAGALLP